MRIAIVGAGMAGLSCAAPLRDQGHEVILFDKGRGPGGRMSTKRLESPIGPLSFDHGAQYFTARDAHFTSQVTAWEAQGRVARWPSAGLGAWVGTPGMNGVIRAMAQDHDTRWSTLVNRIEPEDSSWSLHGEAGCLGEFQAVILAVPAEQALPFLSLHDFTLAREVMLVRSQPCWTAMFAFAEPLPTSRDVIRNSGDIAWAARNSAKPGRSGPESWVVQASPEWSQAFLEATADWVWEHLLTELSRALAARLPAPAVARSHRWRYAMSGGLDRGALWSPQKGLGVCGDWLLGPRVECAWLSGQRLAAAIRDNPPASATS